MDAPVHNPLPPFKAYSGSRQPKILLVGEAWGETEERLRRPFLGEAGKELFRMMGEAWPDLQPELQQEVRSTLRYGDAWVKPRDQWLEAAGVAMTNVLALRPPGNKLEPLCASKAEVGKDYPHKALKQGQYLRWEFLGELQRLKEEITAAKPNLLLALGNTACWALLGVSGISAIRGTVVESSLGKVLPTYHPAAILYQWQHRTTTVVDLMKALRESAYPEVRRPERQVLVSPTIEELEEWTARTLQLMPSLLACDIETARGLITCISFAHSQFESVVVPFSSPTGAGNFWKSQALEERAWMCVKALLEAGIGLLFQNGMYDLQYLLRMGFKPRNCAQDTMLLHHSLYPEMLKSLGFLGSVYTSEPAWKLMRKHKMDTEKREE